MATIQAGDTVKVKFLNHGAKKASVFVAGSQCGRACCAAEVADPFTFRIVGNTSSNGCGVSGRHYINLKNNRINKELYGATHGTLAYCTFSRRNDQKQFFQVLDPQQGLAEVAPDEVKYDTEYILTCIRENTWCHTDPRCKAYCRNGVAYYDTRNWYGRDFKCVKPCVVFCRV
mmetsp:Transcript_122798/g.358396  ORF Transcript_122798/g.358396 Transcript_122798/m.358396 type:complete len:173 (-) Transcript_122798:64-582(-)